MTRETRGGAEAITPYPDVEREPCERCDGPGAMTRYLKGEVGRETIARSCPDCGQPPRCRMGCAADHQCPQPAVFDELLDYWMCWWHSRQRELLDEAGEWEDALFFIEQWRELANRVGNDPLVDMVWWGEAEAHSNIARCQRELAALAMPDLRERPAR